MFIAFNYTLILSQQWQLSDQLCYCPWKNYEAFALVGICVIQTSDIQLFRLQLLFYLLFEELLSEKGRKEELVGGEKLPLFVQPYVQEPQELEAGREEKVSSDTC